MWERVQYFLISRNSAYVDLLLSGEKSKDFCCEE